jgi:peptidoglycan/xylan/chitin deacetylase (PgdA/CDA1 family)
MAGDGFQPSLICAGLASRRMHRRDALRAVTAVTLGAVAGCDAAAQSPARSTAPNSPEPYAAPSAVPVTVTPALPGEVRHGPRDRPQVALTFHGQGDPGLATAVLAALETGGARATVLAVGSWLRDQPALARRILSGGHELGNHTQNHAALAELDDAGIYAEISACAQTLRALTGSIGSWFRPSQTQYATPAIQAQAARAGYRCCLSYDVDSLDYTDPGPQAVVANTLGAVGNGSIVSLHLGHAGTLAALPELLAGLRARGLRPVTVTELLAP